MAAADEQRTCKRCNGTGLRNCGVVHLGVPGLCYGCDGSRVQQWVTAEQINHEATRQRDRHIQELRDDIAALDAAWTAGTLRERIYRQWRDKSNGTLELVLATPAREVRRGEWRPGRRAVAVATTTTSQERQA